MRSRTVREGSVGLLILLGLGLFGGLILWIRGLSFGRKSYTVIVEFLNVAGIQIGAPVRYRGVPVGKITGIQPGSNGVDVVMEISSADLILPRDVRVEANQSGLISETLVDIIPQTTLPPDVQVSKPLDPRCRESNLIVCDGTRLQGQIGISYDELIRSTIRVATVYSQPEFYANVNALTKNASAAASGVAQLTRDLSGLSVGVKEELKNFSAAANSVNRAANQTSAQVGLLTNQLGNTATQFGATANQINRTANQYSLSAEQLNRLLTNVNSLVVTNRGTLVTTLNNLSASSQQLRQTVGTLSPTFNRFSQGQLIRNLETLSANAAQASANLRDLTVTFNTPANVLMLQQTLESARATFQNANKITADLDELTGDPTFRANLKNLVNGLNGLVSSTEQLEQQIQTAQVLEPMATAFPSGTGEPLVVSRPSQLTFSALPEGEAASEPSVVNPELQKPFLQPQLNLSSPQLPPLQLPTSSAEGLKKSTSKQVKPLQQTPQSAPAASYPGDTEVKGLVWGEESTQLPADKDS